MTWVYRTCSRAIERKLREVEQLPAADAQLLLGDGESAGDELEAQAV